MSNSSKGRVERKHKTDKIFSRFTYRKALPHLLKDFENRCGYSMVHVIEVGESEMEIDHHNPKKKRASPYSNLYPAIALVNGAKGENWPSEELLRMKIRFLDPCTEIDYGVQIFEFPKDHAREFELVGSNPAANWHIDMLDLNNASLVNKRRERAALLEVSKKQVLAKPEAIKKVNDAQQIVRQVLEILNYKIPAIPPPPPGLVE